MCLGMRNGTTDMMKDTFSTCCTGKWYMNVHVWLVLENHGYREILRHIQHTYSEKGSDKYKDSWEVYCCPSVVRTTYITTHY